MGQSKTSNRRLSLRANIFETLAGNRNVANLGGSKSRWTVAAMMALGTAFGSGMSVSGPSALLQAADPVRVSDFDCPPGTVPVRPAPYCPPTPYIVPDHRTPMQMTPPRPAPNQLNPSRPAQPGQRGDGSAGDAMIPVPPRDPFRDDERAPGQPDGDLNIGDFDSPVQPSATPPGPLPANNTPNNFANINASDFQSNFASTQASFSSAPTMIGDFAGGGFAQINTTFTREFSMYAIGTGGPQPDFDILPTGGIFPDILSSGIGSDGSGDTLVDTFDILEPLPPTDAPTAPGPGFVFQGGTATFVGATPTGTVPVNGAFSAGSNWFLTYSYDQQIGGGSGSVAARPVPSPGLTGRRIKISENFSPEVRDRFFVNHSFFNDVVGGVGDISRFVMGMEQVLVDGLFSVEFRMPVAATYGSEQSLDREVDRDMEIGNFTILGKLMLLRNDNISWSAGLGIGTPTAHDIEVNMRGAELFQVRNETVQLQPFTGLLFRRGDWVFQSYMQLDVAAGGDSVFVNSNLANPGQGRLQKVGEFVDSTLMHLDFSAHRVLYNNNRAKWLSTVVGNAELHYSGTLEDTDLISGNNFTYSNLSPTSHVVNATFGTHLVFGKRRNVVVTPAMAVPLRDGFNREFDYEAILQVNYIR